MVKRHYSTLDDALRGSAMARRRWLAPLLVLCGVVGADDASAEIGFDFVMATVVFHNVRYLGATGEGGGAPV